jgi:type VI secretion system protein ImpA
MSVIELDRLLQKISDEKPCGEDVWLMVEPDLEQRLKASASDINWGSLRDRCCEVLSVESKDLRAALYLAVALLGSDGIPGFELGMKVLHKLLQEHWENLFPKHIPGQMPPKRVNVLEWMAPRGADSLRIRSRLRNAPLTNGGEVSQVTLRDIEYATGRVPPPEGMTPPSMENVEAAFTQSEYEYLNEVATSAAGAANELKQIAALLGQPERAGVAPMLSELVDILTTIKDEVAPRAEKLKPAPVTDPVEESGPLDATKPGEQQRSAVDGAIRSDRDVLQSLDRIIDYYRRTQPANPLPMLLERAKTWVGKSFVELLADLNVDAKDTLAMVLRYQPPEG